MSMKKLMWPTLAVLSLTAGSYFATMSAEHSHNLLQAQPMDNSTGRQTPVVSTDQTSAASDMSRIFRTVHTALKDSVVNISTIRTIKAVHTTRSVPDGLRQMLPPEMNPFDGGPEQQGGRMSGTGSGVIVSADGYILTNNHVVEGADTISVRLDDDRELKAKVIGRDPKSDLAVIKIDQTGLTYAKFGDSDAIDVGDWVLAFGSPFGFEQTMTQGIISAKGRQVNIIGANNPSLQGLTYENFLQTDAAINPGNSGGPLVNLKGEVVGINSAIASRNGAYNGIGFAIPSNDAHYIMDSLIKNGRVIRGYLGVRISDVHDPQTSKTAQSFGYTGAHGVLVEDLTDDSPGAKGGLKRGDVITAINGKTVHDIMQLRTIVARTAPNAKIDLSVFRDGKTVELSFPVGTQPDSALASASPAEESPTTDDAQFQSTDLGVTVQDVTEDIAKSINAKPGQGVVVTAVTPDSLASDLGLQRGDVIVDVHGVPVHSVQQFKDAVAKRKLSDGIRLSVHSGTGDRFVYLQRQ